MAEDNLVEEFEKEVGKKKKTKTRKKTASKKASSKKTASKKDDTHLFNLVVAVVVILGIIGIVFGYTKDKISEINKGGTDATKGLEQQVTELKTQLDKLKDKAQKLEEDSISNKDVVIDLFDKNRRIPEAVEATDWNVLEDKSFTVSFPKNWEIADDFSNELEPVVNKKKTENEVDQEIVYLQPIGQADYASAMTLRTDYPDFAGLLIEEKLEIFQELNLLDEVTFMHGNLLYFINLDKDDNEVPTVLVLTDDNIYRLTFNVPNKKILNYFTYRQDFEKIAATFALTPDLSEVDEE